MTDHFAIVDPAGRRVMTYHLGMPGGRVLAVSNTYGSRLECCLALIFRFGDFPDLRCAPVEGDALDDVIPLSPPQPELCA